MSQSKALVLDNSRDFKFKTLEYIGVPLISKSNLWEHIVLKYRLSSLPCFPAFTCFRVIHNISSVLQKK